MRSHSGIIVLSLLGAALACSTPGAATTTAEPPTAQVIVITATPAPATSGPPPAPTKPQPTAPTGGSGPKFSSEVKFSTEANPATATRTFKAGVKRIYGMWTYSGMTAGLNVRREWYLNGELWIKREQPWDLGKYGESGTVLDVSIFDEEKGLPNGQWEVRLYIDDQPQFAGDPDINFRSFSIGPLTGDGPGLGPGGTLSPDGKLVAAVEPVNSLQIGDSGGNWRNLVTAHWITGFAWMPDSKHIVYSDKEDDGSGPFGVSHHLYMIDVETGSTTKLSNPDENLRSPVVSPGGKYIALLQGSGYGDACGVDLKVAIMEIDPAAMTRVALVNMTDYTGFAEVGEERFPVDGPDFKMPGVWQGSTQFKIAVRYTCTDGSDDGVYVLDVVGKTATKVAALPPP